MEELELALDDCLEKMISGKLSLRQCLELYPQYAEQLRPLLDTALCMHGNRELRAPSALRDRIRQQLKKQLNESAIEQPAPVKSARQAMVM